MCLWMQGAQRHRPHNNTGHNFNFFLIDIVKEVQA